MSREIKVARATGIIASASIIGFILSCLKINIIAKEFGATRIYDAYLIAFTIPNIISGLLVGAMSVYLIPFFSDYLINKGRKEAWDFFNKFFNLAFLSSLIITILIILFSRVITPLIVPGFSQADTDLSLQLMRIMLPLIVIMTIAKLLSEFLNAHKHFTMPAFAQPMNMAVIIACVILLYKRIGIYSLAWGVLLGAISRVLIQLPLFIKKSSHFNLGLDLKHPGIKRTVLLTFPLLLGSSFNQLGLIVERILASHLAEGNISYLGYARMFTRLPVEIIMGAIATAVFPYISQFAASGDIAELKKYIVKGIGIGNLVLVPVALGFILLGKPILEVLVEGGKFTPYMTDATYNALFIYAFTIFASVPYYITTNTCFAIQHIKITIKIAIIMACINIALNIILVKHFGYLGLALGASSTMIIHSLILIQVTSRKIQGMEGGRLLNSLIKILLAALIANLVCRAGWNYLSAINSLLILKVAFIVCLGIALYLVTLYLLKVEELRSIFKVIKGRI